MVAAEVEGKHLGRVFEDNVEVDVERDIKVNPEGTVEDSVAGDFEGGVNGEFTDDNKAKLEGSVEGNLELDIEGDREEPRFEAVTRRDDVDYNEKMKSIDVKGDVDREKVKMPLTGEEGIEEENVDGPKGEVVCGVNADISKDDSREAEDWSEVEEETYSQQKVVEIPKWVSAFQHEKVEEKGSDNYPLERPEEWSDVEEDGKEDEEEREVKCEKGDVDNYVEGEYFNDSAHGDSWGSRKGHNRAGSLKDSKAPSNETIDQSTSKTCDPVISNPIITAKRSRGTIARFVSYGLAGVSVILGVMACMDAWKSPTSMPVSTTMCPTLATELEGSRTACAPRY
ncbi:hypothetical protein BC829DRAFT_48551 [Chytridium lagenaria]|nr:hypothetical protein BC829DRAFT_48551 [Chytridium lagenaria]